MNSKRSLWKIALSKLILKSIKKSHVLKKSDILEVGCGIGRIAFVTNAEQTFKSYTGIDPQKDKIAYARKFYGKKRDMRFLVGAAEKIPLRKKFDIILFIFSWQFIKDYNQAMMELKRILKKMEE